MILFKKIRWKNLLSTGDHYTEIDFTKNSTNLIIGSNGAGKCVDINTIISLRNKKTGEIVKLTIGEFYEIQKKQDDCGKN
jgi:ABC-type branched-subunit amino acid transport system ATPase component